MEDTSDDDVDARKARLGVAEEDVIQLWETEALRLRRETTATAAETPAAGTFGSERNSGMRVNPMVQQPQDMRGD